MRAIRSRPVRPGSRQTCTRRPATSPRLSYTPEWEPGRLRLARAARHRRQRQDLVLVRYSVPYSYRGFKALTAGAAWRGRHSDLFGSRGGRLQERRDLSGRTVGTGEPYSARRHRLRLPRARGRFLAHARLGVGPGGPADQGRGRRLAAEDHQCPLAARRAADPRGAGRTRGAFVLAGRHPTDADLRVRSQRSGLRDAVSEVRSQRRRLRDAVSETGPQKIQDYVSDRRRAGDGASARAQRRQHPPNLDGHRPDYRDGVSRLARHRRQPSRRVGLRRRRSVERHGLAPRAGAFAGRTRPPGHAPQAHDRVRQLGR